MIVSIHQPHYLPWLGYLDKIDTADTFVLLDSVQFEKNGWQNRNKIKTSDGWMWLTVPVKHSISMTIAETEIVSNSKWGRKHLQALITNYSGSSFFDDYRSYFEQIYSENVRTISDLNSDMLAFFLKEIGITTKIMTASSLGELPMEPNERLAAIVARLGGDIYLAGAGSKEYFQEGPFRQAGIQVRFQDYNPVVYKQQHGEFIPGLSCVDALFNCGSDILSIIREGRRTML